MIDLELSADQQLLVRTVRDYMATEFAPFIQEWDSEHTYHPDTFAKLGEIGLTGICFPERYGGSGMDYISLGLASEELEYVDTSLRTILSVHIGLSGMGIYIWGTEDQKQRFLRPMASGRRFGAFGLTEPNAGSDVAAITTTARRDGDSYVLRGEKTWVSYADHADCFLIFAKTDPEAGHRGISAFVVERDQSREALETRPIKQKASIFAGDTGSVILNDVRVPAGNRIGEEGEGFVIAMSCLENGRYTVASGACGTIRASYDASVEYAGQREAFGRPIGKFQLVQQMIAKMYQSYEAGRLLCYKAGYLKNVGAPSNRAVSLAKWFCCDAAFQAASDAVEVFGAYGCSDEYPVFRFMRNARAPVIYEGTREIHTVLQGEYALGYRSDKQPRRSLPAFDGEQHASTEPEPIPVPAGRA
ncbi:MAG TPA: acyl-CoA dehydrogenase family protein [Chloroflexota bacterium]|nr:acyl-CoA dehydrogenase family protein [Chloroflexota bacterium]